MFRLYNRGLVYERKLNSRELFYHRPIIQQSAAFYLALDFQRFSPSCISTGFRIEKLHFLLEVQDNLLGQSVNSNGSVSDGDHIARFGMPCSVRLTPRAASFEAFQTASTLKSGSSNTVENGNSEHVRVPLLSKVRFSSPLRPRHLSSRGSFAFSTKLVKSDIE